MIYVSLKRVNALMLKYYYVSVRSIDRIFYIVFWPSIAVLLWGFLSTYLREGFEVNIFALLIAGFIFYQFFQRCQTDIPLYLLGDFWSDNLQNVYSTPITKWDSLVSLSIFSIIKAIIVFGVTVLVAILFFNFNLFSADPFYLGLWLVNLLFFALGMGIFLAGIIFRYGMQIQVTAWSVSFLLQPIMAVFYPVSILPLGLQVVARFIPASYVFEGMRQVLTHGTMNFNGYFVSFVLNIVLIIIACFFYSWAFNHNKRHGRLVHAE
jgi:ABC-2 type transport system permease protein